MKTATTIGKGRLMPSLVFATLVTVVIVGVETACAGTAPMNKLRALRQPAWSPPTWAWVVLGLSWYSISFVALVRLYPRPGTALAISLLVSLLMANALVNIPQFRWNRLDVAFFYLIPYWMLLALFLVTVRIQDAITFRLFAAYAVYQLYAGAWQWQLWRLNRRAQT